MNAWPLGGADLYHRNAHQRSLRRGEPGNIAHALYELDGALDPEVLRARAQVLWSLAPMLAGDGGHWPGSTLHAREGAEPDVVVEDWDGDAEAFLARWSARPLPDSWAPQLVLGRGATTALLIRFCHAHLDAGGAHRLVRALESGRIASPLIEPPRDLVRRARRGHSLPARFVAAHVLALRQAALRWLPGMWAPARSDDPPTLVLRSLDAAASRRHFEGGEVGFRLYAIAAQALVEVGAVPRWRRLCVPVPVTLRSRAWAGPVVGNALCGIQLHLPARQLGSRAAARRVVRRAWEGSMRRLEDVLGFGTFELARWVPPPLFALMARAFVPWDRTSLLASYVRLEVGAEGALMGLPVLRSIVLGAPLSPPGLGVVFTRAQGRLTVVVNSRGTGLAGPLLDAILRRLADRDA